MTVLKNVIYYKCNWQTKIESANRKKEKKMRNDLYSLVNEFNNLFYDGGYKGFPVDVIEAENGYRVIAEIPGVKKENIQIEFEDGILTITANTEKAENVKYLIHERNNQKLKRTINFGDIDEDTIKANYNNGLLVVDINVKKEEEKVKKTIEIQ